MKMKPFLIALCLSLVLVGLSTFALTDQQAAGLASRFIPEAVSKIAGTGLYGDGYIQMVIEDPLKQIQFNDGHLRYLAFTMQGDASQYVLLGWETGEGNLFWRLLKSADGGASYSVWQDTPSWVSTARMWHFRLRDITNDGVPEILIEADYGESLAIFAWRESRMVTITPIEQVGPVMYGSLPESGEGFFSNGGVHLEDLDGDRVAEVVVGVEEERIRTEDGGYDWRPLTPTRIFKYDGAKYVLWKEIPWSDNDPFPVTVPSIALLHPGTIPFSELIRFEQERQAGKAKASGSDEGLRIFVSHPAGQATVDDFETNAFVCDGQGLSFQKRWPNAKQPDTTSANWEWGGCPIHQAPCAKGEAAKGSAPAAGEGGCAHWNFSPEDPFMPSPDKKMEYHFVGPYLELRLPKAAVYPFVYRAALDAFTKEPTRTEYFVEVPISGKMKNGKLAGVSALVCVERTGNEKIAAPAPPPAPVAKETPATPAPKDAVAGAPAVPTPATPAPAEPFKASPETK